MKIFYRFTALPESHSTVFPSDHINVADVKTRVIKERNFGNGRDFDLHVYDNDTKMMNDDDRLYDLQHIRVRRTPAAKPGKGGAYKYISIE